jgi:tetratricopeptide (TPR) repeat protein
MSIANLPAELEQAGPSQTRCYELGGLKLAQGDFDGAIAAYRQALALGPPDARIYNNLGSALLKRTRPDEAIEMFEQSRTLDPHYHRPLVNLGLALREAGRPLEAIERLREALDLMPNHVPALVNLGDAQIQAGEISSGIETLERAAQLAPGLPEASMGLGVALFRAGRIGSAIDLLQRVVASAPNHADSHTNLGHVLFAAGEWRAAWPHFEFRFTRISRRVELDTPAGVSRWDGRLPPDRELWLIGEQGLGDQLQFVRYAKWLAQLGADCVVRCDPRLVKLLEVARLGARIVPYGGGSPESGAAWFPLMSLPQPHGTSPETVPFPDGYLEALPALVERWQARVPQLGLRAAIAWAGNPRAETGVHVGRSPPLAALAPLLSVPDVRLVSLQKSEAARALDEWPPSSSILRFSDLDSGADAFLDTAAILRCVDLLVTSDSAIAHLAGALGVRTWLCLMHDADWRWPTEGTRTPWYHAVRIFRQAAPGDWGSVYRRVAAELEQLVRSRPGER